MYAFLNIGSNIGNRRLNLSKAVAEIEKLVGYFELSHTLETHPWGYVSDKTLTLSRRSRDDSTRLPTAMPTARMPTGRWISISWLSTS